MTAGKGKKALMDRLSHEAIARLTRFCSKYKVPTNIPVDSKQSLTLEKESVSSNVQPIDQILEMENLIILPEQNASPTQVKSLDLRR